MDPIPVILRRCAESSDDELFQRLETRTVGERAHLVETLAILGELQVRGAAIPKGYPSLFVYCTQGLGYCERTAYRRIAAAKAGRAYPIILEKLASGRLHLSAVVLLREHLTAENHAALLARAEGAPLDQLKRMAAALAPAAAVPPERTRVIAVVERKDIFAGLEEQAGNGGPPAPVGQSELPPAPPRPPMKFVTEHVFTLSDGAEAKLVRARELLSHKFPMGELEAIFEVALDSLLDAVDPSRRIARPAAAPRGIDAQTRYIPEWVKRKARERDQDRCAFVSPEGHRCGEKRFLQFDHIVPWSLGGRSDDPDNIRQLCAAHNRWSWRHAFVTRS